MYDTVSSTNTEVSITYYNLNKIRCEKCIDGYQQDNSGIFHVCPICKGTGWREVKRECVPCVPYYPPCNPWYPIPWDQPGTYDTFPPQQYIITC